MQKRVLTILATLFVVLIILTMLTEKKTPPDEKMMLAFSTNSSYQFDWPANQASDFRLSKLEPLAIPNYIYCEFKKNIPQNQTDLSDKLSTTVSMIIDCERHQRILQLVTTQPAMDFGLGMMGFGGYGMHSTEYIPQNLENMIIDPTHAVASHWRLSPFMINGDPFILLRHHPLQKIENQSIKVTATFSVSDKTRSEFSILNTQGQFKEKGDFPVFFYTLPSSERLAGVTHQTSFFSLYEFNNGIPKQTKRWENIKKPNELIVVDDNTFLVYDRPHERYYFLFANQSSSTVEFEQGPVFDLTPEDLLPRGNLFLRPLNNDPDLPCLVYIDTPSFPIYEIQTDKIPTGDVTQIFKLLGYRYNMRPLAAVNENQTILFHDHNPHIDILPIDQETMHYRTRSQRADGSPGPINPTLQTIDWPKGAKTIQTFPIENGHTFLMFHDQAFWTMQWDGKNKRQIFPWN